MARAYKQLKSDASPLEDVFGLDEDDLTLNRRGQLSDDQRALLASVSGGTKVGTLVAGVAMLLSIGVLGAIVVTQTDQTAPKVAVGVVAGVALLLFVGAIVRGWWAKRDARAEKITALEGPVKRKVKRSSDTIHERYYLTVGRTKFLVSTREQLEAFNDDGHYLVHIIRYPGAPLVLSAARVR